MKVLIRPLNQREKIIAFLALGVICFYSLRNYLFLPWKAREAALDQAILEGMKILKKNSLNLGEVRDFQARYDQAVAPLRQRNSDEQEMLTLLSQVETLAGQKDLRVAEMKPGKGRTTESCHFLSVGLSLEGPLLNIEQFLYAAQSPAYELGIEELLMESKFSQKDTIACRIELSRLFIFH